MPFLGLMRNRVEITGKNYCRVDMSFIRFGINPSSRPEYTIQFITVSAFHFPRAQSDWGEVTHLGIFDEPAEGKQIGVVELAHSVRISLGARADFSPGALTFDSSLLFENSTA